jgi:DNA replication protein DnaC
MKRHAGGIKSLHKLMAEYGNPDLIRAKAKQMEKAQTPEQLDQRPDLAFGVHSDYEQACQACGGMGLVRHDVGISDPAFGKLHPCPECRGTAKLDHLRKISRLGDELATIDFQHFDPRFHLGQVVGKVKTWMIANYGWLTLSGPHGTGKTFLLAAMANQYIRLGTPALYTTVADLLGDLQATFHPKSNQVYSKLFANVMDVDVLLLDEAEKFHGTEWAQVQVFRLLEHRSRSLSQYKTVLATNTDLRPLVANPGSVSLYAGSLFPNYIESRISGGMIITDFWQETDFRPIMAKNFKNQGEVL